MTFTDLKKLFLREKNKILLFGLIFSVLSSFFKLLIPESFVTQGTFILTPHLTEFSESNNYNYDGYYLDQVASSYSKTVTGLIDTPEFKLSITEDSLQNNRINLFNLSMGASFKEISPRLLVLSVHSNSFNNSKERFDLYEKELLNIIDSFSDRKFELSRISDSELTYNNSLNFWFYPLIGFLFGSFFYLTIIFLKETKNEN